MKVLIFDLKGDYGHFRAFYSTSSPVTFSVIPPTALLGIIGAILGLPKEQNEYLQILNKAKTKVAVQILRPVKKVRMGLNLINTVDNYWIPTQRKAGARTQVKYEFLKEPAYRIFVAMDDEDLLSSLVQMIQNHKTYYTISLGLSELLADILYIGVENFISVVNETQYVDVITTVPMSSIKEKGILIRDGMKFLKERIPLAMNKERIVSCYEEVLMETQGKAMTLKLNNYWKSSDSHLSIVFLHKEPEL